MCPFFGGSTVLYNNIVISFLYRIQSPAEEVVPSQQHFQSIHLPEENTLSHPPQQQLKAAPSEYRGL